MMTSTQVVFLSAATLLAMPLALCGQQRKVPPAPFDPFAPLMIYAGTWTVRAEHPWKGGAAGPENHLVSRCERFTRYFACEQTVDGEVQSLLIYTATPEKGVLHCRTLNPEGLAGGRGDLMLNGSHWTYLDKPPASLKGNWSRVENFVLDRDHIRFEEFESSDEGKTWTKTNAGLEERSTS